MVGLLCGFKTRVAAGPEEEPMGGETEVLAPFEDLFDQIGGNVG